MAQLIKNLPAKRETWVQPLGREDPLKKGKATHSSLKNSMDCIVHAVAKSQIQLSKFPFTSVSYLSFHSYDKATKEVRFWVFPGGPVGKTSMLSMQGAWVPSLVGKLRSHRPKLRVPMSQLKILHAGTGSQ